MLALRGDRARAADTVRGILSGYGFQAANPATIAARRPLLADFLGRCGRAQLGVGEHGARCAAILVRETGLDQDIALATVTNVRWAPAPIDAAVVEEEIRMFWRFRAPGALTATPDLTAAFDPSSNADAAV